MRALTAIVACGAIAAACTSNKPAEEPAHFAQNEPVSTNTTPASEAAPPQTMAPPTTALDEARGEDPSRTTGTEPTPPLSAVREPAPASAPETMPPPSGSRPDVDNTRVNKRDQSGGTLTPMDQGSSDADLKTTQRIRQAVVADDSLSFAAKNVKIITVNGRVTLRGTVKSDQERQVIGDAARKIAGPSNVDDQLEIKK